MKGRDIVLSDLEEALKFGKVEDSILRYKHLEIVLSEDKSKLVTAWNNGKEKVQTVISKKEQKILSLKHIENTKSKIEPKTETTIELNNYEDYLEFLKSKR